MDVLCAGHVNWDVTLPVEALPAADGEATIDDQTQAAGGSAANTAAALAGLDVDTGLLGSVGDDDPGLLARRELTEAGVDCDLVVEASGQTTVKYLVVDAAGEVMVLANEGVNETFTPADLPDDALAAARHLHLTGQDPDTAATLARRAAEAGLSVSLDPGRRVCDRDFSGAASHADYLFVNDREHDCAPDSLLDAFEGTTVVKHGTDGGSVSGATDVTRDGYDVPATDTTGAGDAFAAGFIASVLDGAAHERALSVANACGALAAREMGARVDISWTDVTRLTD